MHYFAGLDISMDETRVCVLDREGEVVHEGKTASTALSAQTTGNQLEKTANTGHLALRRHPTNVG
jgi:hypothetical protein